jgi:hypothetical protein
MRRAILAAAVLALAACAHDDGNKGIDHPWKPSQADWSAEFSKGVTVDGNVISMPVPQSSAHYITKRGSLANATAMRVRFTLDRPVAAKSDPNAPASATLYFQRCGDDMSAEGDKEAYRWYASFATVYLPGPGTYEMSAPLSGNWTAVKTSSRDTNPEGFAAAIADTCRIGFVLGGGTGLGHGVTGPATLTIDEFEVL